MTDYVEEWMKNEVSMRERSEVTRMRTGRKPSPLLSHHILSNLLFSPLLFSSLPIQSNLLSPSLLFSSPLYSSSPLLTILLFSFSPLLSILLASPAFHLLSNHYLTYLAMPHRRRPDSSSTRTHRTQSSRTMQRILHTVVQ